VLLAASSGLSSAIMTAILSPLAANAANAALLDLGGTAAQGAAASTAVLASAGSSYLVAANAASAAAIAAGATSAMGAGAANGVILASPGTSSFVSSDFDLSMAATTGAIKFLKSAIYHLGWQLQARITAPVPNPVPSWSFGFWLDGVLVPGSIYSGFTQAPGDDACHSTGDLQIQVNAGQVLKLRNTSVSSVNLNPNVTGAVFPITIASINIECLKTLT
jgi:hypothetical protein